MHDNLVLLALDLADLRVLFVYKVRVATTRDEMLSRTDRGGGTNAAAHQLINELSTTTFGGIVSSLVLCGCCGRDRRRFF
jgi:hypothetical protein